MRIQIEDDKLYIHHSSGPEGPFLTVSYPILKDHEGTEWVYFEDPWALHELISEFPSIHAEPWAMKDDYVNSATLKSIKEII